MNRKISVGNTVQFRATAWLSFLFLEIIDTVTVTISSTWFQESKKSKTFNCDDFVQDLKQRYNIRCQNNKTLTGSYSDILSIKTALETKLQELQAEKGRDNIKRTDEKDVDDRKKILNPSSGQNDISEHVQDNFELPNKISLEDDHDKGRKASVRTATDIYLETQKTSFIQQNSWEQHQDDFCDFFSKNTNLLHTNETATKIELDQSKVETSKNAYCHLSDNSNSVMRQNEAISNVPHIPYPGSYQNIVPSSSNVITHQPMQHQFAIAHYDPNIRSLSFRSTLTNLSIHLHQGDMVHQGTDVIVNSSDMHLSNNGCLAQTIIKAAGWSVSFECQNFIRTHGFIHSGYAIYTTAGALRQKYIIHAVGPNFDQAHQNEGQSYEFLCRAISDSLDLAAMRLPQPIQSLSIPLVGAKVLGTQRACEAAYKILRDFDLYWRRFWPYNRTCLTDIHLISNDPTEIDTILRNFYSWIPSTYCC